MRALVISAIFSLLAAPALAGPKQITKFPKVSLKALGAAEKTAFLSIVNEEVCPCACPKTFAQCLSKAGSCEAAELMANWMVTQLAEGVAPDQIASQVTDEIAGFQSKPKPISTDGFHGSRGKRKAPYTIVEFADFECPHCKFASPALKRVLEQNPGKVRIVFKHFPLAFHAMAKPAAAAAEAAGEQGLFWEMHDALFATQQMLDEDLIMGHAKALGLNVDRFTADMKSPGTAAKIEASRAEGERLGIEATPSFFVNGRPFGLMRTPEAFELRLKMEDARKSAKCR
jgi:protein-disulfide isomerase